MDTSKSGFAARLNSALDSKGVPPPNQGRQVETAAMFNITQGSARKWLLGISFPEIEKLPEIARKLNISLSWLITGQGDMEAGSPEPALASAKIDSTLLEGVIDAVQRVCDAEGIDISAKRLAKISSLLYEHFVEANKRVDESTVKLMLKMA